MRLVISIVVSFLAGAGSAGAVPGELMMWRFMPEAHHCGMGDQYPSYVAERLEYANRVIPSVPQEEMRHIQSLSSQYLGSLADNAKADRIMQSMINRPMYPLYLVRENLDRFRGAVREANSRLSDEDAFVVGIGLISYSSAYTDALNVYLRSINSRNKSSLSRENLERLYVDTGALMKFLDGYVKCKFVKSKFGKS